MWPLKNKISYLRYKDVKLDDDENTLTLIHNKGANRFTKNDVLNYSFESDIFSPSGDDYSLMNKFLMFVLFGGVLNMFYALFPPFVWENVNTPKVLSQIWFDGKLVVIHHIILLSLTVLLSYTLYLLIIYVLKRYRINNRLNEYSKDILTISLNNAQIKVRLGRWEKVDEEVLFFLGVDPEKSLSLSSANFESKQNKIIPGLNYRHLGILSIIIVPIYLLNFDMPFWFNTGSWGEYWKYFGTWDGRGGVINMINPIKAFIDGIISNSISPFLLLIFLILLVLVLFLASISAYVLLWPTVLFYCSFLWVFRHKTNILKYRIIAFITFVFCGASLFAGIFPFHLGVRIISDWDRYFFYCYIIFGVLFITISNLFLRRFIEPANLVKVISLEILEPPDEDY